MASGQRPQPGPIVRTLMRRRLSPSQIDLLSAELDELYQHRTATEGRPAADRWLRREYRRWTLRLLGGGLAANLTVSDGVRPRSSGIGLVQDLRHNLRGLRRAPLFSAALILTVGIGIGGTTLVFAVVHSVLISPLPYPDADRMVLLRTVHGADMWGTSMADLDALYDPPPAFEAIAGYSYGSSPITLADGVDLVRVKLVTDNYFPLLGIQPILGRGFTPEESRPGGADAVLVTEAFWDRTLGSDPAALGSALVIDGEPHTIVGILPDGLGPLDRVEIYPVLRVETPTRKGPFFFQTVGRIRAGIDPGVARAQLDAVAKRSFPVWQDSFPLQEATLGFVDLKEVIVGNVARTLLTVLTAVSLLLLIASANAASLLVARGMTRVREVSIRAALGASTKRLFRLLLGEAAILAGGGALLGLGLAWFGVGVVRRLGLGQLPRVEELSLSPPVIAFFLTITAGSWALFGVVASSAVLRRRTEGLATSAIRSTASKGMRRLRRGLVAAQFAISIPLLVGSGLLGTSLGRLQSQDLGFDPEGLVSMQVSLPEQAYPDEGAVLAFWDAVLPELEALPGVIDAGLADARPPVQSPGANNFVFEDRAPLAGEENLQAPWITADPGYFETLGVRVVEGRIFNDPRTDTMRTAVVDEAWGERFFPGQSPLGRRFRSGGCTIDGCPLVEVVGVVSNVKTTGLDDSFGEGTVYYDFRRDTYSSMNLHLRTGSDPLAVVPAVRRLIADRDPTIPVADIMTADDVASESLMGRRYTSLLVALLAAVALLLSVVGIYAAMSYFVRQQSREIGIRIALGGGPDSALRMVIGQGMRVAAIGTLIGAVGALALTRYMASLLYDVTATDPIVFVSVCAGTLLVAFSASAIPGRAAAGTDPATTLREE